MRMFNGYTMVIGRKIGMGMINGPVVDDMGMIKKRDSCIVPYKDDQKKIFYKSARYRFKNNHHSQGIYSFIHLDKNPAGQICKNIFFPEFYSYMNLL